MQWWYNAEAGDEIEQRIKKEELLKKIDELDKKYKGSNNCNEYAKYIAKEFGMDINGLANDMFNNYGVDMSLKEAVKIAQQGKIIFMVTDGGAENGHIALIRPDSIYTDKRVGQEIYVAHRSRNQSVPIGSRVNFRRAWSSTRYQNAVNQNKVRFILKD